MIEILYYSWGWVDLLAIIIAIIGFTFAFVEKKQIKSRKGKNVIRACLLLIIAFLSASFVVHLSFVRMPDIISQELSDAKYYLSEKGLEVELMVGSCIEESSDNIVRWSSKNKWDLVYKGETIVLYASIYEDDESDYSEEDLKTETEDTDERVIVPDVTRMTELEAIQTLKASGLKFTASLYGVETEVDDDKTYYVVSQEIPAGSEVDAGTIVRLWLFGVNYVAQ